MRPRAFYGVVVKFAGNAAEDVELLSLETFRVKKRQVKESEVQPWPQHLIDLVNASCPPGGDKDPLFSTAYGAAADEEDDGDDDYAAMADRPQEMMPVGAHGIAHDIMGSITGPTPPPIQILSTDEPLPPGYHAVPLPLAHEEAPLGRGAAEEGGSADGAAAAEDGAAAAEDEAAAAEDGAAAAEDGAAAAEGGAAASKDGSGIAPGIDTLGEIDEPTQPHPRTARSPAGVRMGAGRPHGHYSLRNREVDHSFHIRVTEALDKHGVEGLRAMYKELAQIDGKGVFTGVQQSSLTREQLRAAIRSQLIFKEKFLPDGEFDKLKARLVAGGHMQDRALYPDVSAPTATTEAVLMVATIAARERRRVVTVDIDAAFLQAEMPKDGPEVIIRLDRIVAAALAHVNAKYEEFIGTDGFTYVKLNRPLYGIVEAAQLWHDDVVGTCVGDDFEPNTADGCVLNKGVGEEQITVVIHVDDLLVTARKPEHIDAFLALLRKAYTKITVHEGEKLPYLGMTLDFSCAGKVKLTQYGYIDGLLEECGGTRTAATPAADNLFVVDARSPPLDKSRAEELHSRVCKVQYLSKRTRPDLLTAVAFLTTRVLEPTAQDWRKLERVVAYLKGTHRHGLCLSADDHVIRVIAHVDASYGVHGDMRSHTGAAISLGGGAFYSKSGKQKLNTKSSTEAELVGLSDSASMVIWVRNFLVAQGYGVPPGVICQDNQSTMALAAKGHSTSNRTRHIAVRFFWVKDRVDAGELAIEYLPTGDMVADMLTKPLQGAAFLRLRALLLGWDEA
jgi:hypothetical protein